MRLPTLADFAKEKVSFGRYQDGQLWYWILIDRGIDTVPRFETFEFPIPIEDAGGGEFLPSMKGLNLLRWYRKHKELVEKAQEEQESEKLKNKLDMWEAHDVPLLTHGD